MSLLSYFQPSNLRIGTKLAVTSGLAIVLVAAMVGMQWMSGRSIQTSTEISRLQVGVFSDALAAQAALRGLQISVRDIRLAAAYKPRDLERYIYPRPAEEAAELIERAIAQRARRMDLVDEVR